MATPFNFSFELTKSIISKPGACRNLGEVILNKFNSKKVLIVTDPMLTKLGIVDPLLSSLKKSNIPTAVYDGCLPDAPMQCLLDAKKMADDSRPDIVVGIGGGSSMDIAKVVAYWSKSGQDLDTMYGVEQLTGDRLPLIQIPTTAGTGSEATKNSILKYSETEKRAIVSYKLLPDLAVLDAETTYGLPPHVTAMTGIDAMIHALEAYTGKNLKNPLSDIYARSALQIMSKNLMRCMDDPKNPEARTAMLYGSFLAATAFCNSPVSGVHALAYPLA